MLEKDIVFIDLGKVKEKNVVFLSRHQSEAGTNYLLTVNYSQSTGTTLSGDSKSFTLGRNNNVTIPVTYTFAVLNPGVNTYAVQFEGISVNTSQGNQLINFMQDLSSWRTNVQ